MFLHTTLNPFRLFWNEFLKTLLLRSLKRLFFSLCIDLRQNFCTLLFVCSLVTFLSFQRSLSSLRGFTGRRSSYKVTVFDQMSMMRLFLVDVFSSRLTINDFGKTKTHPFRKEIVNVHNHITFDSKDKWNFKSLIRRKCQQGIFLIMKMSCWLSPTFHS